MAEVDPRQTEVRRNSEFDWRALQDLRKAGEGPY
jgi:hypothetical protein